MVFTSKAALVPGDTNSCGDPVGPCQDIYVHDRGTGQTTRVSVATGGTEANGPSDWPNISRNGRYVTFTSHATNLAASDTNAASDVFVHDRVTGTTTRVSVSTTGTQGGAGLHSLRSRINEDGTIVAFHVLGPADATNRIRSAATGWSCYRAFVHDRTAGTDSSASHWPSRRRSRRHHAPAPPQRSGTLEGMRLDASGRWVALTVAETASAHFGPKIVSLIYDRVAARTLVVDAVNRISYGPSSLAFSGDGYRGRIEHLFLQQGGVQPGETRSYDRLRGQVISGDYPPEELSFTGDVATFVANGDVHARDFDSDDDQMRDEWETAFGLDPTVGRWRVGSRWGRADQPAGARGGHASARRVGKRYFAEGAANAFFTTRLAIAQSECPAGRRRRSASSATSGLQSSIAEARPRERAPHADPDAADGHAGERLLDA